MSSGKVHDRVNYSVMFGTLVLGLITKSDPLMITGFGIGLGTYILSPDLDLPRSNPTNRLGVFRFLMTPYRGLCGHHRSFISHSPIISSLIRVAYCLAPVVIWGLTTGNTNVVSRVVLSSDFLYLLLGLEIATDIHLLLDWQYSAFKKHRRLK